MVSLFVWILATFLVKVGVPWEKLVVYLLQLIQVDIVKVAQLIILLMALVTYGLRALVNLDAALLEEKRLILEA